MLATTFVWRKKFAAEVVVTRKGSPCHNTYKYITIAIYRWSKKIKRTPQMSQQYSSTPAHNTLIKYRGQLTTGRAEYAGGKKRSF
jgi:ABC-type transport system involved in Fe-S cluster assembly fused permease/ATPase subunit